MKFNNIIKTTEILNIILSLLIIFLLIFYIDTISGNATNKLLLLDRGTSPFAAVINLGIGCLLIICSFIKYKTPLRKVLSGELVNNNN